MSAQPQADIFLPLKGESFASYTELERAIRERFRANRRRFPSDFSYRDAIVWADSRGWLTVREGRLVVDVPARDHAA